ncbi:MAG: hypothetical protein C5B50_23955 [Verrucomicrobia bacterium]|nr:MAG: hypothetical protein C5B50_23955 [Verrucomicrobiota bacterium]
MKPIPTLSTRKLLLITTLVCLGLGVDRTFAQSPSADALINKLVQKGILTEKEAKDLLAETAVTNAATAHKWKITDTIKSIELYGDVRFRYEYRSSENANPPVEGSDPNAYYKERFRYAVRLGVRGDLADDFYYGLRLETATNPRSPWVTFGGDNNTPDKSTPFRKDSASINLGQYYLGWHPTDWFDITVGKMRMADCLYTTPMVWDTDINPEGAAEKFKLPVGNYIELFANFAQFDYQNPSVAQNWPSSDTFILAWQVGANVKFNKDTSLKFAPVIYNYTGLGATNTQGSTAGLNLSYTGEGFGPGSAAPGQNSFATPWLNQNGINDLLVLEIPAELNFKIAGQNVRVFGDFARNLHGDDRARAAFAANNPPGVPGTLTHAYTGQDTAYQIGVGIGNLGLVYGQTSKKHTWEARAYWQHIEQYALDVNLIDSDFFEGRANLEGVYSALAYSLTDNILGTFRYGYAHRINDELGTGGSNPDLPVLNPIRNYHLLQMDLTWRF